MIAVIIIFLISRLIKDENMGQVENQLSLTIQSSKII